MLFRTTKFILFHNDTDIPIVVDSWVDGSNILQYLKIQPREKLVIHSSVGEWHLNGMLYGEDRKLWDDKGLQKYVLVGKFRSDPCAYGDYSWMEYDDNVFKCEYSKLDNYQDKRVKGLMTFSLNEALLNTK
uniref:Uncharacterized protein n=1 Tax=viral metagenome TaxID=1070528 RepID=A0A6C0ASD1_9ZZZZ